MHCIIRANDEQKKLLLSCIFSLRPDLHFHEELEDWTRDPERILYRYQSYQGLELFGLFSLRFVYKNGVVVEWDSEEFPRVFHYEELKFSDLVAILDLVEEKLEPSNSVGQKGPDPTFRFRAIHERSIQCVDGSRQQSSSSKESVGVTSSGKEGKGQPARSAGGS